MTPFCMSLGVRVLSVKNSLWDDNDCQWILFNVSDCVNWITVLSVNTGQKLLGKQCRT